MNLKNIYFKKPSELNNLELIDCFSKFYPEKCKFLIKNWKWLYRTELFGHEPIIMMYEKCMIGFAGSISTNIVKENNIIRAKWFVDFVIEDKKRNLGLGKILTKKWMDNDSVCLTFCNNISLKIFKGFGWTESAPVYETRLILNPVKFIKVLKRFNIDFFRHLFTSSKPIVDITPVKIKNNRNIIIELFNIHNLKKSNNKIYICRDEHWLDWRIFRSPLVDRYLLFEYKSSFLIIDFFFLNGIKRLSILFSSLNNECEKQILLSNLLVWAGNNSIDAIWHVFMESNFLKKKIFQKTIKLNFIFFHKNIKSNQKFSDLQGLDGDNDLLFYNNYNIEN